MQSQYSGQDLFYWLKRPTIAEVRAVLNWAHKRAMRTDVFCSDTAKMVRRQPSDKPFEEVVSHIIDLFLTKETLSTMLRTYKKPRRGLDNQTRFMEKRAQQLRFRFDLAKRISDTNRKISNITSRIVGKANIFTVRPDGFNWIEFRGISRKPFNADRGTVGRDELADELGFVNPPVVHDDDLLARDDSVQTLQEFQDVLRGDVVLMTFEEKIEGFSLRRDCNRADNREPVMPLPVLENRRLAFDRPGLSDDGREHESRLVNEDDRLFFPDWPVVLSSANLSAATLPPALRSALWPSSVASGNSIPGPALFARRGRDGTLLKTSSRLPSRFAPVSITGSDTRALLGLSTALCAIVAFVFGSFGTVDADAAGLSTPIPHALPPNSAIVISTTMRTLSAGALPSASFLLPAALWLAVSVLLTLERFRTFSYIYLSHIFNKLSIGITNINNGKSKPYFRVILRKNRNWFLLLTDKLHIEDMLEIGIRGVEINGEEYFTFSYLKKEMLGKLMKKFLFKDQIV